MLYSFKAAWEPQMADNPFQNIKYCNTAGEEDVVKICKLMCLPVAHNLFVHPVDCEKRKKEITFIIHVNSDLAPT